MSFTHSPRIITDSLVLCLDAANISSYVSGSTLWYDLTANGYNGTLTNGPTYNSSNGGAIVFDGIDDYVLVNNSSVLNFGTNGITVGAWAKTTNLGTTQPQQIIAKWGFTSKTFQLRIDEQNKNTFNFVISDGTSANGVGLAAGTAVVNTWQYVVGTFDNPNDLMTLYVNGISAGTASYTGSFGGTEVINIGRMNYAAGNYWYFVGSIAETQMYSRALTAQEVQQNYNALRGRFGV